MIKKGLLPAASRDLVHWQRQSYPVVIENNNCLEIEVSYDQDNKQYIVSWLSAKGADSLAYYVATIDFKNYSPAKPFPKSNRLNLRQNLMLANQPETGTIKPIEQTNEGVSVPPETPVYVEARNPVIWADVPDPSVIRVGDTYYMSSTTMHMNPGLFLLQLGRHRMAGDR